MKSFEKEIAEIADVELSTLVGSYKYSVYGGHTVVIEGQKGVRSYSDEAVCFSLGKEKLTVSGSNLTICRLGKNFVAVRGKIKSVEVFS